MLIKKNYRYPEILVRNFIYFFKQRLSTTAAFIDINSLKKDTTVVYDTKQYLKAIKIGLKTKPRIMKDLLPNYEFIVPKLYKLRGLLRRAGYNVDSDFAGIYKLIKEIMD